MLADAQPKFCHARPILFLFKSMKSEHIRKMWCNLIN